MVLRSLTEKDEAALTELLTDETIKLTYMLPDLPSREAAIPLARKLTALSAEETRFVRGMEEGGVLVGFLNDVEMADGTIELGYVVHPRHRNKGCATAALKLAMEELFHMGFREVVCGAFEENPASLRVMEKAGMGRIDKVDMIDYRGKLHRCLDCSIVC